jgi:hypothetical protein
MYVYMCVPNTKPQTARYLENIGETLGRLRAEDTAGKQLDVRSQKLDPPHNENAKAVFKTRFGGMLLKAYKSINLWSSNKELPSVNVCVQNECMDPLCYHTSEVEATTPNFHTILDR